MGMPLWIGTRIGNLIRLPCMSMVAIISLKKIRTLFPNKEIINFDLWICRKIKWKQQFYFKYNTSFVNRQIIALTSIFICIRHRHWVPIHIHKKINQFDQQHFWDFPYLLYTIKLYNLYGYKNITKIRKKSIAIVSFYINNIKV